MEVGERGQGTERLLRTVPEQQLGLLYHESPRFVRPMLARRVEEPFSREGWIFEPKWDGIRCVAVKQGSTVELYARSGRRIDQSFPLIAATLAEEEEDFVLDGEIVAMQDGLPSFSLLQGRMHVGDPDAELIKRIPAALYAFDLLILGNASLQDLPLITRKQVLRQTIRFRGMLRYSDHIETDGIGYYRAACEKGIEGIIAKRADSPYVPRRTSDWLKMKCEMRQEFVIGGYTAPKGSRSSFGALLVGVHRGGALRYAGKVGTGFSDESLKVLHALLKTRQVEDPPFLDPPAEGVWVRPELVAEVRFTEWTEDGKLRHPAFIGLRNDKDAKDVMRE